MKKCKGENCTAIDGHGHSEECIYEHQKTVEGGLLDTAGNRNPGARWRGYKGVQLWPTANDDEKAAWKEGHNARN